MALPDDAPRRATKGERTRARLLVAAEDVFGATGFHDASIVEITRGAGVALGTFYTHFSSKLDIFRELISTRGHEMRSELAMASQGRGSRAEMERAGLEAIVRWIRDHPAIYRIMHNAEFVEPDLYREWYVRLAEAYAESLRRSMVAGEIPDGNAEAFAYCVMGIADFMGMRWILWEDTLDDDVFDSILGFVLGGLGLPRSTR